MFEIRVLENALKEVHSEADAAALANMIMKLIDTGISADTIDTHSEMILLRALINHERKTCRSPSFVHICELLEKGELKSVLQEESGLEAIAQSPEEIKSRFIVNVTLRLMGFRLLAKR